MEKPHNPQEYSSPGWFFVAMGRAGFGAAGAGPTADPLALDMILDRRDVAGGPRGPGWQSGATGAGTGTGLSQSSSSRSSMSKASSSRSSVPRLCPAAGAVPWALRAVLVRGCIPFLGPGLLSQLLSQDCRLSLRAAPSLAPPLAPGSSSAPCFEAHELSKVWLALAEELLE